MNPKLLAQTETQAWQAYYKKNNNALIENIRKMFELQYGIEADQANAITLDYAKAAAIFGNLPIDSPQSVYAEKVLPLLIQSYKTLNQHHPLNNYQEAAKYDLDWWIKRRNPKTSDPSIVGNSMAKMYVAVYGNSNSMSIERAAYLRALAGQYRDLSHSEWDGVNQQDWIVIHDNLLQAYKILDQATKDND